MRRGFKAQTLTRFQPEWAPKAQPRRALWVRTVPGAQGGLPRAAWRGLQTADGTILFPVSRALFLLIASVV